MAKQFGDKLVLLMPLANNLQKSDNYFAVQLARVSEAFPEKAKELLRGYNDLVDRGVLRIDDNGDLEMTELGVSHAKLFTMMAVCGENVSKVGPLGDSVLKLKGEGLLKIDEFGTIDIVVGKIKKFFEELEQLIRFSEADLDKDTMIKDLDGIRSEMLGE